jgi:hypothetical protein
LGKQLTLIFLSTLLICSLFLVNAANAKTNVNGEITGNTVWKSNGSPYVFTGAVVVAENAVLTIEPGVTVELASFSLQVKGVIQAIGDSSKPIKFTSNAAESNLTQIFFEASSVDYNETDGTGCIIENAEISTSITIQGSAPKICGCQINGGISIIQAAPTVSGNTISGANFVYGVNVEQESTPAIISNVIMEKSVGVCFNLDSNGYANNDYDVDVENNTIVGCLVGIGVGDCQGYIRLYGNLICSGADGIKVVNTVSGTNVDIKQNLIMNNTCGLNVGAQVSIHSNTFYNNTVGIYYNIDTQSLISNNNIMNSTQYNIEVTSVSPSMLEATYNYWGTLDIPTINQTIYDKNNNETLGEVKYLPPLESPDTDAPAIPNVDMNPTPVSTSTSTPIQTPTKTDQPTQTATAPTGALNFLENEMGYIEIGVIAALLAVLILIITIVLRRKSKNQ